MKWRPRLWYMHRNFFVIFFTMALVFHLGFGLSMIIDPDRYRDVPSLVRVNDVASFQEWGAMHVFVWALMTVGAYRNFALFARVGLAIGVVLCLARGLLIELAPGAAGGGLFVWFPMAMQHYVMSAEPQENPLTTRQRTE